MNIVYWQTIESCLFFLWRIARGNKMRKTKIFVVQSLLAIFELALLNLLLFVHRSRLQLSTCGNCGAVEQNEEMWKSFFLFAMINVVWNHFDGCSLANYEQLQPSNHLSPCSLWSPCYEFTMHIHWPVMACTLVHLADNIRHDHSIENDLWEQPTSFAISSIPLREGFFLHIWTGHPTTNTVIRHLFCENINSWPTGYNSKVQIK